MSETDTVSAQERTRNQCDLRWSELLRPALRPNNARDAGPAAAAALLRATLGQTPVLSGGERALLEELLIRIADGGERRNAGTAPARLPRE
jgi:hypothetical protein